jgi:hypothetical protein
MEKKFEKLVKELEALNENPNVYLSSAEENLADMGISLPAFDATTAEKVAYLIELREMVRSSYGV